MAEEYRAMKYCSLCSQNNQNSEQSANYRHQAMIACEEAIKTYDKKLEECKDNTLKHYISARKTCIETALNQCVSCNGEGLIKKTLEHKDSQKIKIILDKLTFHKRIFSDTDEEINF